MDIVICSKNPDLRARAESAYLAQAARPCRFIGIDNSDGKLSLAQAYNTGIAQSESDLIVFSHEDVLMLTPGWDEIIRTIFSTHADLGALGVAGSRYLDATGTWWNYGRTVTCGHVIHHQKDRFWLSDFGDCPEPSMPAAVLDGLFLAVSRKTLEATRIQFDTHIPGFHFYDLALSAQFIRAKRVNRVARDILLLHDSIGETNAGWEQNRQLFIQRYADLLPLQSPDFTGTPKTPEPIIHYPITAPEELAFLNSLYR